MGVLFVASDPEKWAPRYRLAVTIATYILPLVVELIAYTIAYHKINRRISNAIHSKQVLAVVCQEVPQGFCHYCCGIRRVHTSFVHLGNSTVTSSVHAFIPRGLSCRHDRVLSLRYKCHLLRVLYT